MSQIEADKQNQLKQFYLENLQLPELMMRKPEQLEIRQKSNEVQLDSIIQSNDPVINGDNNGQDTQDVLDNVDHKQTNSYQENSSKISLSKEELMNSLDKQFIELFESKEDSTLKQTEENSKHNSMFLASEDSQKENLVNNKKSKKSQYISLQELSRSFSNYNQELVNCNYHCSQKGKNNEQGSIYKQCESNSEIFNYQSNTSMQSQQIGPQQQTQVHYPLLDCSNQVENNINNGLNYYKVKNLALGVQQQLSASKYSSLIESSENINQFASSSQNHLNQADKVFENVNNIVEKIFRKAIQGKEDIKLSEIKDTNNPTNNKVCEEDDLQQLIKLINKGQNQNNTIPALFEQPLFPNQQESDIFSNQEFLNNNSNSYNKQSQPLQQQDGKVEQQQQDIKNNVFSQQLLVIQQDQDSQIMEQEKQEQINFSNTQINNTNKFTNNISSTSNRSQKLQQLNEIINLLKHGQYNKTTQKLQQIEELQQIEDNNQQQQNQLQQNQLDKDKEQAILENIYEEEDLSEEDLNQQIPTFSQNKRNFSFCNKEPVRFIESPNQKNVGISISSNNGIKQHNQSQKYIQDGNKENSTQEKKDKMVNILRDMQKEAILLNDIPNRDIQEQIKENQFMTCQQEQIQDLLDNQKLFNSNKLTKQQSESLVNKLMADAKRRRLEQNLKEKLKMQENELKQQQQSNDTKSKNYRTPNSKKEDLLSKEKVKQRSNSRKRAISPNIITTLKRNNKNVQSLEKLDNQSRLQYQTPQKFTVQNGNSCSAIQKKQNWRLNQSNSGKNISKQNNGCNKIQQQPLDIIILNKNQTTPMAEDQQQDQIMDQQNQKNQLQPGQKSKLIPSTVSLTSIRQHIKQKAQQPQQVPQQQLKSQNNIGQFKSFKGQIKSSQQFNSNNIFGGKTKDISPQNKYQQSKNQQQKGKSVILKKHDENIEKSYINQIQSNDTVKKQRDFFDRKNNLASYAASQKPEKLQTPQFVKQTVSESIHLDTALSDISMSQKGEQDINLDDFTSFLQKNPDFIKFMVDKYQQMVKQQQHQTINQQQNQKPRAQQSNNNKFLSKSLSIQSPDRLILSSQDGAANSESEIIQQNNFNNCLTEANINDQELISNIIQPFDLQDPEDLLNQY